MKVHRIYALVARYLYLYRRSLPRMMEIFYWPFLDLVIWGFITVYLMKFQGQIPGAVTFFYRRVDSVGYSVSSSAGNYDFVSGGDLGEKSHELIRQSAQAERVPCRDDGHERLQSDGRFCGDGGLRRPVLLLQYLRDRDVAGSVRLESRDDGMDYRGADHGPHHAVWPGSGSPGLEHGVSVPAHLLCVLSDGGAPRLAAGHCMDEPGCPCV